MPVHPLEGGGEDALLRRRSWEFIAMHLGVDAAVDEALRHLFVLAGLAEAADVGLHGFTQPWQGKVPLVGQPVTPAPGFNVGIELLSEDAYHLVFGAGSDQIKVVAQVRPMVEGLHYDCRTI